MRHNPTVFKGRYDPDGAYAWLHGVDKIFRAMATTDVQKVRLATHMLSEEAESWGLNTCQRLMATGVVISWVVFKDAFLEKYFPEDVKCKKEIEFLELKQGNMSVADYAAKFEELSRFCHGYLVGGSDVSKCVKFENGLRPESKQFIGYQQIKVFAELVNKCRIFDEDSRARASYYKKVNDKKGKGQERGKPYGRAAGKGKTNGGSSSSGGGGSLKCFKCGGAEKIADCKQGAVKCFKCGDEGHRANKCKRDFKCFIFGEK